MGKKGRARRDAASAASLARRQPKHPKLKAPRIVRPPAPKPPVIVEPVEVAPVAVAAQPDLDSMSYAELKQLGGTLTPVVWARSTAELREKLREALAP